MTHDENNNDLLTVGNDGVGFAKMANINVLLIYS